MMWRIGAGLLSGSMLISLALLRVAKEGGTSEFGYGIHARQWTCRTCKRVDQEALSEEEMKDIEENLKRRRELLERKCQQLEQSLPKTPKDASHLRMYPEHNLAWCENYKVGSSTWASHLLTLARVTIHQHTPIHRLAARHFSPIKEPVERKRFLLSATTFLVVRHPFERLLSAFMDKLSKPITRKTHRPTAEHPHWSFFPFGNIQEAIRSKYRRGAGNKSAPTFAEFLAYLVCKLFVAVLIGEV